MPVRIATRFICIVLFVAPLVGCPQRSQVWLRAGSTSSQPTFELGHRRQHATPLALWTLNVRECRTGGQYVWRLAVNRALQLPEYQRPVWDVDPKLNTHYSVLRYGEPPQGYAQDGPARPLVPGYCYLVETEAEGRGYTGFRVANDGTLHELSAEEDDALYAASRVGITQPDGRVRPFTASEHDSAVRVWHAPQLADSVAMAQCYAGYREARSRGDTNLVDRQVRYDTTADGLLTFDHWPGRGLTCQFVCTKVGPNAAPDERTRRSLCEPARSRWIW